MPARRSAAGILPVGVDLNLVCWRARGKRRNGRLRGFITQGWSAPGRDGAACPGDLCSLCLPERLESGNPVPKAGVPVTFTPDSTRPGSLSPGPVTVATDAQGVATATFTAPPGTGKQLRYHGIIRTLSPERCQGHPREPVATFLTVTATGTAFSSGSQVAFTIEARDPNGDLVAIPDDILLSCLGTGSRSRAQAARSSRPSHCGL